MIHIAIVEDMAFDRKVLRDCLTEYARKNKEELRITEFTDGAHLLSDYPEQLDLVFMDIMMDEMDGLTAARRLRRRDTKVLLVFVTSMVQYAVQGYSVDAMDFLVKPVNYMGVRLCMDRVRKRLERDGSQKISVSNRDGIHSLSTSEICYFELLNHRVMIHTTEETIPVDFSLAEAEKLVSSCPFFRCHVSFLVNLQYVDQVKGNDVWVHGDRLSISRYRRKEFLDAWSQWLG
ncbi:MAG: LytTR family DNA-binding domain-containing protein [Oscillospiraceae bacterium]|nr:LytTR family DNA-binding domain-containing protein [Oscillospiraceae bacterium]